ncbi:hypothetical protein KY326_03465, partial [Candidatus Woesearchaeota archaeon]|nr:hypothetical protein [Candidatus Woesearchaeota archaeon]
LVSYFLKNNIKHFQAQDPSIIYDILEEKKAKLYKLMPRIRALKPRYTPGNKVSLYEGYKALKQLYDHLLFEMKKGEERLVLGAQPETAHFLGKTYFKEYTLRRIKKKIKMRIIFNADAKKTAKEYAKMSHTKVRILPKGTNSQAATDIYPDKVSILLLKEKPQIFHIECKEVAQSYKDYFELLWEMSEEVKK